MQIARKHFLSIFLLWFCIGCSSKHRSTIQANAKIDSSDVRLGTSEYYIKLPSYLELTEARGKEGQLGYSIEPKDTSLRMFGSIEVKRGNPIGNSTMKEGTPKEKVQSSFLGRQINWAIYQTETGYFVAQTPKETINAYVASNKRSDIDTLIAVMATLTKR